MRPSCLLAGRRSSISIRAHDEKGIVHQDEQPGKCHSNCNHVHSVLGELGNGFREWKDQYSMHPLEAQLKRRKVFCTGTKPHE